MKTFLLTTLSFLAFTINSKAQWTLTGSSIYPTTITNNVGIGTASPLTPLDVKLATNQHIQFAPNVNGGYSGASGIVCINDANNAYTPLGFFASNYYFGNGNVGIGTTSPASKLAVATASANNSIDQTIAIIQSSGLAAFGGYIGQRVASSNTRQGLIVSGGASLTLQAQAYNMDFIMGAVTPTDDTNLRMRILANGNVGIGTSAPDQLLTVNGTIHSKSVVVDANIFPDYVFNSTYKLPTLTEVKTYIDQNHHLPDVPSAADVEKNGLNLGEMNKVLVEKVEELTLYLIEQNKQVAELNKQLIKQNTNLSDQQKANQSQQKQIDAMKKSLDDLNHKKTK